MVHPMYIKILTNEWVCIREQSFTFGWKNYNHEKTERVKKPDDKKNNL